MASAIIICMLLGCIIGGECLVLRHRTPQVVRVREGSTLVLQADVESEEDNLWFYGPGNRQVGEFDHRVDITREEFVIQLYIWRVDRYQSGVYFLKGFDRWSNERLNWSVIVQVVPEYHVTLDTAPTSCAAVENPERSYVTWEYLGCDVVIRDADSKLVKEYNHCGELTRLESEERKRLLMEAVQTKDIIKLKTLLLLGTRVNYNLTSVGSPLCAASRKGNVEISQLLLNTGASITSLSDESELIYIAQGISKMMFSPLECAALSGSVQLVKIFLDRGANIGDKYPVRKRGTYLLLKTRSFSMNEPIITCLDDAYPTAIHFAAMSGSLSLVQYLIDIGADAQSTDILGNTPLFYAVQSGSVELVKLLVSLGSDPLSTNQADETPIVYAAYSGSVPMFELLLQWGADITSKGYDAESLLHIAAGKGHLSLVQKLIGEGLNVTAGDDIGRTPLHYAAYEGHLAIVKVLIKAGAITPIIDKYNITALEYAVLQNKYKVANWLLREYTVYYSDVKPRAFF
ncbi:putative ankyrin repeat protein RF_0381 [Periplaneta americana]|uniref:putative ankyrin repeat protein RF_0381 n=1 Tax=Periplaneta americana TaxID=6978 RepID=UPI0037E7EB40